MKKSQVSSKAVDVFSLSGRLVRMVIRGERTHDLLGIFYFDRPHTN